MWGKEYGERDKGYGVRNRGMQKEEGDMSERHGARNRSIR